MFRRSIIVVYFYFHSLLLWVFLYSLYVFLYVFLCIGYIWDNCNNVQFICSMSGIKHLLWISNVSLPVIGVPSKVAITESENNTFRKMSAPTETSIIVHSTRIYLIIYRCSWYDALCVLYLYNMQIVWKF